MHPLKIQVNGNIIKIGDTSNYSDYKRGGIIFNVKKQKSFTFDSFKERLEEPIKEGEEYNDPLDFLNPNIQEILQIWLTQII